MAYKDKRYLNDNDISFDYTDIDLSTHPSILATKASTTMSSVIGSVMCLIKDHFVYRFPKNYFKKVYIDTTLANVEQRKDSYQDNAFKSDLPKITFMPSFDTLTDTYFSAPMFEWQKSYRYVFKNTECNYQKVLDDVDNLVFIYGVPDRIKIPMDIKIQCETRMSQINTVNYIKSSFDTQGYYFLNKMPIEVEIPKTYLMLIQKKFGIKSDTSINIEKFNDYLQKYSLNQIACKKNLSTGKYCYYFKSYSNLLCRLEDLSTESSKNNQIDSDIFINFRFSVELWIAGSFILETKQFIEDEEIRKINEITSDDLNSAQIIMNYSTVNPEKMYLNRKLIIWKSYVTDINTDIDELSMSDIVGTKLIEVIEYNNKHNIRNSDIFTIKIYAKTSELRPVKDFMVDWEKLIIKTLYPINYMTYNVAFYADTKLLNNILTKLGY